MSEEKAEQPSKRPQNPYQAYGQGGKHGLLVWLQLKSSTSLHQIIRRYRLDPGGEMAKSRDINILIAFIIERILYQDAEGQVFFRSLWEEEPPTP